MYSSMVNWSFEIGPPQYNSILSYAILSAVSSSFHAAVVPETMVVGSPPGQFLETGVQILDHAV